MKPTPVTFQFSSDNSGLIKRLTKSDDNKLQPRDTTEPDYDIIAQIQQVRDQLRQRKIHLDITHVPGHQDKKRKFHQLNQKEQMNVRADELATEAMETGDIEKTQQMFEEFPAAECQLYIQGQPIHGNAGKAARDEYHILQYRKYMIKNLGWSDEQFDAIDWKATGKAMKKFHYNDQVRLRKLRHKWLPTNKARHRMSDHIPAACPLCQRTETQDHVFTCPHPKRKKIIAQALTDMIQSIRKDGTNDVIANIISEAITNWTDHKRTMYEPSLSLPDKIIAAIEDQNMIGWDNFCAGFLSKQWTEVTDEQNSEEYRTPWITTTFHHVCKFSIDVWLARNDDVHGKDPETERKIQASEQMLEIRSLYNKAAHLPHKYQTYFHRDLHRWEEASTREMNAWIVQMKAIMRHHASDQKEKRSTARQNIRRYMRTDDI
jgi:hypothetical protein